MKEIRRFYQWIKNPNGAGKYTGRIVVCIFSVTILSIFALIRLTPINADATNGMSSNDEGINEVKMASIEYVCTFDGNVPLETQESIIEYMYSTIDSVKLLHMVNMRQHIRFGYYEEMWITEDTIYCPIDAPVIELEEAMNSLP